MQQIKLKMTENQELSLLQKSIVLIHCLNIDKGLACEDQNGNKCDFPTSWRNHIQGIYKINYRIILDSTNILIQFRYVDLGDTLSVNFVSQGSHELFHYLLKLNSSEEKIELQYCKQLNKLYQQQFKKSRPSYQQIKLKPVPLQIEPRPNIYPKPLNIGLPFNNPFGKEEYVGPQSSLFNKQGPMRIPQRNPFGIRSDPIDPFHSSGFSNNPDFQSFDQFGRPNMSRFSQRPTNNQNNGFGSNYKFF